IVFTLTVVGYTLIGGFLAAVWTDLFQSVLMWVGVMLLLPLAMVAAGGLPAASERLRYEMVAQTAAPAEAQEQTERLAPVVAQLHDVDTALRNYADEHDGQLPDRLSESPGARVSAWDPKGKAQYFGRGNRIDTAKATQRVPLVVTGPNDAGWRAVLYS